MTTKRAGRRSLGEDQRPKNNEASGFVDSSLQQPSARFNRPSAPPHKRGGGSRLSRGTANDGHPPRSDFNGPHRGEPPTTGTGADDGDLTPEDCRDGDPRCAGVWLTRGGRGLCGLVGECPRDRAGTCPVGRLQRRIERRRRLGRPA